MKTGGESCRRLSLIAIALVATLSAAGCLTRTAGPTLPYVKPAQSVAPVDPTPIRIASRVEDMETEIQRLRGSIERLEVTGGSEQAIRNLQDRVAVIERQLGIDSGRVASPGQPVQSGDQRAPIQARTEARAGGRVSPQTPEQSAAPVEIQNDPILPDEKVYRDAYTLFKNGSFDQAAIQFEDLLKKHPQSQLVPDAIYWIGEARLSQGRFDEAVLQFDRVLKEFPGSKKELNALLNQGQAFEKMGDAKSAKIIYQKLVSEFPHTAQGRLASGKLKSLASH
ncbi:MAG TPA: tol-pal system protein YbgF [Desulfomonilaceae bacterium]|nr:tol-pal system protein YbgF [Desulfomonilaceae bacterium]